MKKIWILILITIVLLAIGCTQNEENSDINSKSKDVNNDNNLINEQENVVNNAIEENEVPILTKEEVLRIAKEAHYRYNIVWNFGEGLPDNIFEQLDPIKIDGFEYYYLGTSIDTIEEFNAYLGEVLTDKSIENIMKNEKIIIYEGKLLKLPLDAGNSKKWSDAKITSINQTGRIANVVIEIPLNFIEDIPKSIFKEFTFVFDPNKGWLIDTDTPFEDLY